MTLGTEMESTSELLVDMLAGGFVVVLGAWLLGRRKELRQALAQAPAAVRAVFAIISLFPVLVLSYSFGLFSHPDNFDGWFILGVVETAYLFPATLVVLGSNIARWFCVVWIGVNVPFSILRSGRLLAAPDLFAFVLATWLIQATVLVLLFTPSARAYFTKRPPEPTR